MIAIIRAFLGRIIGAAVAGVAVWLLSKFGVVLTDEQQVRITEAAIIILMVVFTAIYSIVHKLVNTKLNPGDAAAPMLVEKEKNEAERG
jgi:Mn2+/Fe2+ NRAMP family transporter